MSDRIAEPLISIALCTYNGARYLREQVDSLFSQTYKNLEIIAVDDCSSDETVDLLREFARRDSRLQVVVNPINRGFSRNFEYAMSLCRGDFIAPCDQDDIWLLDKLQHLFSAINAGTMVYCDSELVLTDGRLLGMSMSDWWRMQDTRDPAVFAMDNCVSGHAMFFRRSLLSSALPIPDGLFHDWWLAAVAASQDGVIYCPRKLVRYRQHGGNITDLLRARKSDPTKRPAGFGTKRIGDTGRRIACLAGLPGPHQPFLAELHRLWQQYAVQWFSPALARFMIAHRRRLFALRRTSATKQLYKAVMYFWGLRLRRILKRKKYAS